MLNSPNVYEKGGRPWNLDTLREDPIDSSYSWSLSSNHKIIVVEDQQTEPLLREGISYFFYGYRNKDSFHDLNQLEEF